MGELGEQAYRSAYAQRLARFDVTEHLGASADPSGRLVIDD
jgi:hypothetical protein